MTVTHVAYVLLSFCCTAKSDEFVTSTATLVKEMQGKVKALEGMHVESKGFITELSQMLHKARSKMLRIPKDKIGSQGKVTDSSQANSKTEVKDTSHIKDKLSRIDVARDQANEKVEQLRGKVKALEGMDAVAKGFVPNFQQTLIDTREQLQKAQDDVTHDKQLEVRQASSLRFLKAKEGKVQEGLKQEELLQAELTRAQGKLKAEQAKVQEAFNAAAEAKSKLVTIDQEVDANLAVQRGTGHAGNDKIVHLAAPNGVLATKARPSLDPVKWLESSLSGGTIDQEVDANLGVRHRAGHVGNDEIAHLAAPATKGRPSLDPVKRLESSLSGGSVVKQVLLQETMEDEDASHIKDKLSKREEALIKRMKAQDKLRLSRRKKALIKRMKAMHKLKHRMHKSSNAYWRGRVKRLEAYWLRSHIEKSSK